MEKNKKRMFLFLASLAALSSLAFPKVRSFLADTFYHSKLQVCHGLGTANIEHQGRNKHRIFTIKSNRGPLVIPSFIKEIDEYVFLCDPLDIREGLFTEDDVMDTVYEKGVKLPEYGTKCLAIYRRPSDYKNLKKISLVIVNYSETGYYHKIVSDNEFIDYEEYLREYRMLLED